MKSKIKGIKRRTTNDFKKIEKDLNQAYKEQLVGQIFFEDRIGNAKNHSKKISFVDQTINSLNNSAILPISRNIKKSSVPASTTNGSKKYQVSKNDSRLIAKKAKEKKLKNIQPGHDAQLKKIKHFQKLANVKMKTRGGYNLWNDKEASVETDSIKFASHVSATSIPNCILAESLFEKDNNYLVDIVPKPTKKPILKDCRPLGIPAVEVAHPGASYQPTESDHLQAITTAASVEFKKLDESERVEASLWYPPELDLVDDDGDFFGNSSDEEGNNMNEDSARLEADDEMKVRAASRPKTRRERRKKHEQKVRAQQAISWKKLKALNSQISIVEQLEQEVSENQKKLHEDKIIRDMKKQLNAQTKTKKLSRHEVKRLPIEIQLKDEISDSLRELKPEGNLIKERFLSFQARNIIPAIPGVSKKQKQRFKTRYVDSHDYKRFK